MGYEARQRVKVDLQCATDVDSDEVWASVVGQLAVHRAITYTRRMDWHKDTANFVKVPGPRRYTVTHIPTGMLIRQDIWLRQHAITLAKHLVDVLPKQGELGKRPDNYEAIKAKVEAVIAEWRDWTGE